MCAVTLEVNENRMHDVYTALMTYDLYISIYSVVKKFNTVLMPLKICPWKIKAYSNKCKYYIVK